MTNKSGDMDLMRTQLCTTAVKTSQDMNLWKDTTTQMNQLQHFLRQYGSQNSIQWLNENALVADAKSTRTFKSLSSTPDWYASQPNKPHGMHTMITGQPEPWHHMACNDDCMKYEPWPHMTCNDDWDASQLESHMARID